MANPILAAILSFFIPGLGQAYAGDIKRYNIFNYMDNFILTMQEYPNFSEVGDELHGWVYFCK